MSLLVVLVATALDGCLAGADSSAPEAIGEARSALDDCTHAFIFTATPDTCNDAEGHGRLARAGTDKVAATGCEVVDIDTYTSSCEASPCSHLNAWPAGHEDAAHEAAAAAECKRICESPERSCVSFGVAQRSLQSFDWTHVSQCWDGQMNGASCGDDPEENPADWVKDSPCASAVGAGCATAVQRHNVYACLCQPPDGGPPSNENPLGGPGAGAGDPGMHCQLGAGETPSSGAGRWAVMLAAALAALRSGRSGARPRSRRA
ncbi:MAG: hypothetical protein U0359_13375 [Byssovorax sp.]